MSHSTTAGSACISASRQRWAASWPGTAAAPGRRRLSSGPCTPCRGGIEDQQHAPILRERQPRDDRRRPIDGVRARRRAPGRPAGRSPVPSPERARDRAASASASTSSASPCSRREAPPPRQARAVSRSRARHAPEWPRASRCGDRTGRPRCSANRGDMPRRPLRLRAARAARRGVAAELENCLAAHRAPARGCRIAGPDLRSDRETRDAGAPRPKLLRSFACPGSSRDFAAKGGLFGRPRPRIMVRTKPGLRVHCGRDREGDQR